MKSLVPSLLATSIIGVLCATNVCADDLALIHRGQLADAARSGAVVVEDYGSVLWVRGSGQGRNSADVYTMDLGNRHFVPGVDRAADNRVYGSAPALRLVQFHAPLRAEWLQQLRAAGIVPVQHFAPFGYAVWASEATLDNAARGLPALRFAGDFLPEYKLANANAGLRRGENEWRLMVYRGARVDDAELNASGARVIRRAQMDAQFDSVSVELTGSDTIERLARHPAVFAIRPVPRDGGLRAELANQITANNLDGSNQPVPGYAGWLTSLGLDGSGVIMANVDGGIYDTHPDLVNRMLPCVGDTCGGSAVDDHGTHTAGIMAGDASSGTTDSNGFLRGQGMAPGANLVEQVYSPHFNQAGGMLKLMRQSHDNSALLSGNSWGPAGSPQGYDDDTRQVDVGVRDTKPDVPGDQPLTYVLSFMNGGGGSQTQGSPDEAKNVITVGSTKGQISGGAPAVSMNDLSANTAHGPARDGRRIPHLVAPGCSIDSPVSATGYGLLCGTSMASPQVAGAIALFIEHYRNENEGADPSAALIKAALIAATQNLEGFDDADGVTLGNRPDSKQGWGRLRADWLLDSAAPIMYFDQDTHVFDATGESWSRTLAPVDPALPMQIVLTYTDAPGHGTGGTTPAWNNNLDLSAAVGADVYLGNVFGPDALSVTGGSADDRNNIESVILPPAIGAGGVAISVIAAEINSDALPNSGDGTDQDFALVCVNCQLASGFGLDLETSHRTMCGPGDVSWPIELVGFAGYTGTAQMSAGGVPEPATGAFDPSPAPIPGTTEFTLSTGALESGSYVIEVSADDGVEDPQQISLLLEYSTALAAAPVPLAPFHQAQGLSLLPTLTWDPAGDLDEVQEFLIEVDDSPEFDSIDYNATVTAATSHTVTAALAPETTYFWRVTSTNNCGDAVSATYRFTTTALVCTDVASTDVPKTINATPAQSVIEIPEGMTGQVADVDVIAFQGAHTWVNDISASLTSPGSSPVTFMAQSCNSEDGFDIAFNDESALPAGSWPCPPTDGLSYQPSNPLSSLDGTEVAEGDSWTLTVTDNYPSNDNGTLQAWGLRICTFEEEVQALPPEIFEDGFETEVPR